MFGLVLGSTEQRRKEIGIRKVNGAKIGEILLLLNTDFIKWVEIYLGKDQSILSKKSLTMMTSPAISTNIEGPMGKKQSYGYGLLIEDQLLNHSGYIVGFRSDFIVDRKRGLIIVVFSNNTTNDPIRISNGLLKVFESFNP